MTVAAPDPTFALAELRAALEGTADALAHADLDRLLACETRVERALAQLPSVPGAPGSPAGQQVAAEVERARLALTRCRRLGIALTESVRLALQVRGLAPGYGNRPAPDPGLHLLDTTV